MKSFLVPVPALFKQRLTADWVRRVLTICMLLSITACASQVVKLPQDFWQGSPKVVGIVFVKPPPMDSHRMGGEGLLDMAINEAVTDTVSTHLASLNFDKWEKSKSQIVDFIEARGSSAIIIPEYYEASDSYLLPKEQRRTGYFDYDLSSIKSKYAIDHLLVIRVIAAGSIRDYYGFVPLTDPRGYINANVTLVDLSDNRIVLKENIIENVNVEEGAKWDDPDNGFPALTAAVEKALENAGSSLVQRLSGRPIP